MAIRTRASLNATNPYFRRLRHRARQLLFCAPSVLALVLSLLPLQLQLPAWTRFRRSCYCEYACGKLKSPLLQESFVVASSDSAGSTIRVGSAARAYREQ